MFNVGTFAKQVRVRGYSRGRAMILHGPLQLGAVHVLAIECAGSLLRGRDACRKLGIAIAASRPMMAMTIMISMRVNPALCFVFMAFLMH